MRKNGRMIFLHLLWMSIAIMMGVYSCNSGIDDMGVFVGGILICSAIINAVLLYAISVTERNMIGIYIIGMLIFGFISLYYIYQVPRLTSTTDLMVILVNCLGIWFSGGVVISFGINLLILIAQLICLNIVGRNEDDNRDI